MTKAVIKVTSVNLNTVKPRYYGHEGDRNKCPQYRGVRFREVGFRCIWISVSQGQSELFLHLTVLPVDVFVVKQSSFIDVLGKVSPCQTNFGLLKKKIKTKQTALKGRVRVNT